MLLKVINIQETENTPAVILDPDNDRFLISGRSFSQNPYEFFKPIIEWLEKYSLTPNRITNFEFKLEYFNSSSQKAIARILQILKQINEKNIVNIVWYYSEDDDDEKEIGEEFSIHLGMNFEFKKF